MANITTQRLGHYEIIRLLGRGESANVYLARHVHLRTLHAIKILNTPLARKGQRKFLEEARLAAALENEHIVRIQDYGVYGGIPYIVMSYAPHGSLRDQYGRGTQLSFDMILNYLEQIAEALDYLHDQNLIHLDIKLENLLLGRNYEVLLGDFGITEVDHGVPGSRSSTITHMSPEYLRGNPSAASDQYALAVCVYEWLTGQLPFRGASAQIKWQHLHERPASLRALAPDIPSDMEKVVLRALSKDPQRRYPSAEAFVAAFKEAMPTVLPQARSLSLYGSLLARISFLLEYLTKIEKVVVGVFSKNLRQLDLKESTSTVSFRETISPNSRPPTTSTPSEYMMKTVSWEKINRF